eukprot:c13014_g2_i1.p1 GENE.c13014_g2_i1~~c13014_g2_i1.p1  ORF type:complete len:448 (-),score=116.56 c13014_g2_i1:127-1272(-)
MAKAVMLANAAKYTWHDMMDSSPLWGKGETIVLDYHKGSGVSLAVPCVTNSGDFQNGGFDRLSALVEFLNHVYSLPAMDHVNRHMVQLAFGDEAVCPNCADGSKIAPASAPADDAIELIPDCHFLFQNGYSDMRTEMDQLNAESSLNWDSKTNKIFWRGTTTGGPTPEQGHDYMQNQRVHAVSLSLSDKHSAYFDARFSGFVQGDSTTENEFNRLGLMGNGAGRGEWLRYKYVMDLDGNTNSWDGLFWKLLSNSVVFKVTSKNNPPYVEWYYPRLHAWEHFIPVKADLSDLEEKYNWALNNDAKAKQIAEQATVLAKSITMDSEIHFVASLLSKSAANFDQSDVSGAYGSNGLREVKGCDSGAAVVLCNGMHFNEQAKCGA